MQSRIYKNKVPDKVLKSKPVPDENSKKCWKIAHPLSVLQLNLPPESSPMKIGFENHSPVKSGWNFLPPQQSYIN